MTHNPKFKHIFGLAQLTPYFTIFEMKWNPNRNATFPKSFFLENYNVAESHIITPDNYLEFLLP